MKRILRVWFVFLALFAAQMAVLAWTDDVITPRANRWTAATTAGLLRLLGVDAHADDAVVSSSLDTFIVIWECTGVTPVCLFLAAVLAYPAPWRRKATGVGLGIPAILGINQVRLVSLSFIAARWPAFLDTAHVVIWQSLIIFFTVLLWLFWALRVEASPTRTA